MDIKRWGEHCGYLRNGVVLRKRSGENKYLLANFSGTSQGQDVEKRTPLVQDFFRVKVNVKGFSDSEKERRSVKEVDFSKNEEIFSALENEFDMPYWAFTSLPGKAALKDYTNTFIWQLKACNLNCPWCYVDDTNKNGKEDVSSRFFSIPEIIDVFQQERAKQELNMIRPSGGEPTLTPEQWLETLREIYKRGLGDGVYVQGDTNLTTGHFIESLEKTRRIENYLLEEVANFDNFGLLCSFKGTDTESFLKASGMSERYGFLEEERWYSFSKFLRAGIDAYPFIYHSNPETLESFMEKGARKFGDGFYLKTWLFPLKFYGPEKERLEKRKINPETYQKELDENFAKSKEIMQDLIWKKFHLNYQAIPRTGIKLEIKI